jgi:RNA polymerase sigma factor (sigma-70 family)
MSEPDPRGSWIRSTLQRHERPLLRYVVQITGDLEKARDVVQEAFIRLCEQEDWRALEANVKAWLYRVCRNRALDLKKKDRPMRNVADSAFDDHPSDDPSPAKVLELDQSKVLLGQLLGELPAKQREVVQLKFHQGLSYQQISEVTGHSVSNVGYLLHHGVQALRQGMLAADEDVQPVSHQARKGGAR